MGEGDLFSPHPHLENGPVLPPPGAPLCLYGKSCGSPPGRQRADAPPTPTGSPEPSAAMAGPDGPRPPPRRRSFCAHPPAVCTGTPYCQLPCPRRAASRPQAPARQKPPPEGPQHRRQLPAGPPPRRQPPAGQKPPPRARKPPASSPPGRFPTESPPPDKSRPRARNPPASSPSPRPRYFRRAASQLQAPARQKPPPEGPQPRRQLPAGPFPDRKHPRQTKAAARGPSSPSPAPRRAASQPQAPPPDKSRRPTALKTSTRAALPLFTSSPSCSPARWPPCRSGVRSPSRSPPPRQTPSRSPPPVPPDAPAGTVRRGAPAPFASPPGR